MDTLSEDEPPSNDAILILRTPGAARTVADAVLQPVTPSGEELSPGTAQREFVEDETPAPGSRAAVREGKPKKILDETRRTLAVGMLSLVAVIAVLPTLALVLARWTHFSTEAYRELSLVFTPVVALASAAFGFFFASDERNRS
ncbi:hypothetical protein [Streptomyces beigongshangae]|uniref:hypothetical protein n=1 Tax=Streptomyces beigongshangae TaxID=2841597 RepID=UPI001C8431C5|nr:hypothetical protein [Streptomyces sp. REN17]